MCDLQEWDEDLVSMLVWGQEKPYRSRLSALLVLSPLNHSIGHSLGAAPQLIKVEHLTVAHLQKYIYACVLEYGLSWCAPKRNPC